MYALDNLYFSPLKSAEVWDFSKLTEFSPLSLAFLLSRGEMALTTAEKQVLKVQGLTSGFKKGLCLIAGKEEINGVEFDAFLPTVLGNLPSLTYSRTVDCDTDNQIVPILPGDGFNFTGTWKGRQYLSMFRTGDSTARNLPALLKWVSELSFKFNAKGNFFLRTEKQSYLHFMKPNEGLGAVFLQEKEQIHSPFLFLSLDYQQVTEE
ncbi:hypothetical protein LEP1GSC058_0531 [Leptospira fainei serovar Hurstbridge str. BUT 6]|uniref:Uncharacterized protein n=1 Tax=Leptospira fainei serovar Hurstbridge str. BUT 6 TaxID=1193011 RepID=S3V087_9LEPT|nr:hypothetical protein LEP1GSC058_0531 [Leptospira fainei serovar Hurstbridge str. BUT 6]